MNDKILKLAMKSGLGEHLWLNNSDPTEEEAVQQFAELIIQECIVKIDDEHSALGIFGDSDPYELIATYTNAIKFSIQRKFGVDNGF